MADNNISSVSKIEPKNTQASQLYQAYHAYMAQNQHQRTTQTPGKMSDDREKSEGAEQISKLAPGLGSTTALKFEVNSETKELIVLVVDRETQKVVNTIPPEAIKDIPVGDLMQYSI